MQLKIMNISTEDMMNINIETLRHSDFNLFKNQQALDLAINQGHMVNYSRDLILDFTKKKRDSAFFLFCKRIQK